MALAALFNGHYWGAMRVITLNLNGLRSASQKGFWPWMRRQKPDVVCLQEVRARAEDLHPRVLRPRGYHAHLHSSERPGYSGVALLSKRPPDRVRIGMGDPSIDREGRYLAADFGELTVISWYMPSGSSGPARQAVKYETMARIGEHLGRLAKQRELIVCGDFNIAHKAIDLKNWRSNQKNSGFLPEERAWMDRLFGEWGLVDAFRALNAEPEQYTWWSNRGQAWAKNVGWRLDYQVVTPSVARAAQRAAIYTRRRFSDHAPLTIDYRL